jgi:hypothetical protein
VGRNDSAGDAGDAVNVVLAAAGYNFRRLLAWLARRLAFFAAHRGCHRLRVPCEADPTTDLKPLYFTNDCTTLARPWRPQ